MSSVACFTVVRNEAYFLPRWLAHYGAAGADLFVLDHESDDGSTAGIPTNGPPPRRVPVSRPFAEDVNWLRATVEAFQRQLFDGGYKLVMFAEVDEFLVPAPAAGVTLAEGFDNLQHNGVYVHCIVRATGYDVCPGRTWKRSPRYDKTLVSSVPLSWELGFHHPTNVPEPDPDPLLLLLHMHYADPDVAWGRIQARANGKSFVPGEGGFGFQNKFTARAEFDAHFAAETAGAVPIPEEYLGLLP